jgi:hypothetical protein
MLNTKYGGIAELYGLRQKPGIESLTVLPFEAPRPSSNEECDNIVRILEEEFM